MTNAELAADLVRRADSHMAERKACLVAAVALGGSRTVGAARKVLAGWDGPQHIKDAAAELLSHLEET
jgi:hypothetical protein